MAAGLIIMITCLTGAILVFETELQQLFYKQRYFVEAPQGVIRMPADSLIASALKQLPAAKAGGIKLYTDEKRSAEVSLNVHDLAKHKPRSEAGKAPPENPGGEGTRLTAFVNPYTGQVIEIYNYKTSFFSYTMDLHRRVLGNDIGKLVVGICTIIFLFIVVTGIILWWPRNKAILKQRLKLKTDAGFKRLNHDYHIVFGFYSSIFLFIFAFTGLAWSFQFFNKSIYTITGTSMVRSKVPETLSADSLLSTPAETALMLVAGLEPKAHFYSVSLPKHKKESYIINTLPCTAPHETAIDTYYVDTHNGSITGSQKFSERNRGQRIRATFRPVHVASIFGLPGKIIGFVVCLLGTFFPISGIIMWWNRTRKKLKP